MTNDSLLPFLHFAGGVGMELVCTVLAERIERAQQEAARLGHQLDRFRRIGTALLSGFADGFEAAAVEPEPDADAEPAPEGEAAPEAAPPACVTRQEELGSAAEAGDWRHFTSLLTTDESLSICTHILRRLRVASD